MLGSLPLDVCDHVVPFLRAREQVCVLMRCSRNARKVVKRAWRTMTCIDLRGCFVHEVLQWAECCAKLRRINLESCADITDSDVRAVTERCCHITSINLSRCVRLTEVAVLALAQCSGL